MFRIRFSWMVTLAILLLLISACSSPEAASPTLASATESATGGSDVEDATGGSDVEDATGGSDVEDATGGSDVEDSPDTPVPAETTEPAPSVADGPVYGGTITLAFESDIPSMDPPVSWDPDSWSAQLMVYSTLYRFNKGSLELEPEIASGMPQVSDDGMTWTVPLRQDVRFSNGEALTADDVKYTWDRMLDDETQGWATAYYMAVAGADTALSGEADAVTGVSVIDDFTVQFELVEPIAYFDSLLTMPWTGIMNQAHVEAVGENIAREPLGSGPYMMTEYVQAVQAVFEKNPHYFREDEPYADRVVVELSVDASVATLRIERGEIDAYGSLLEPLEYARLRDDPNFAGQTFEIPWLNTFMISVNSIQEGLSDLKVRQAIAHCIDREAIIRAVLGEFGVPAYNILPPGDPFAFMEDIPRYEHDIEKAQSLLAEAGYADGFSFETRTRNSFPRDKWSQIVQGQLAECGIQMELELVDKAAQFEWQSSETNGLVFGNWPYEIPDPSYVIDGGFSEAAMFPDSCCNWSWYSTPELHAKLSDARTELDPVIRGQHYQELDKMLTYDLVLWIPVWHPIYYYAVSENLGGYEPPNAFSPNLTEPARYWSKSGE